MFWPLSALDNSSSLVSPALGLPWSPTRLAGSDGRTNAAILSLASAASWCRRVVHVCIHCFNRISVTSDTANTIENYVSDRCSWIGEETLLLPVSRGDTQNQLAWREIIALARSASWLSSQRPDSNRREAWCGTQKSSGKRRTRYGVNTIIRRRDAASTNKTWMQVPAIHWQMIL